MTRKAFDLYGHKVLAPDDREKYPPFYHWMQETKDWLKRNTDDLLPVAKKKITAKFVAKNNRDWNTKNGYIDQTKSAQIDVEKMSKRFHAVQDCNLLRSLQTVYGSRAIYVKENVKDWALVMAEEVKDLIRDKYGSLDGLNGPAPVAQAARLASVYIRENGLTAPRIEKGYEFSALLKAVCPDWWQRKGEIAVGQMREAWFIGFGEVSASKSPYVSKETLEWSINKTHEQKNWLSQFELVSDYGEIVDMQDMWAKSSSHPEKRRIELMVRLRGIENIAKEDDWLCDFITITAPSKYHPTSKKYNGAIPKETQAYLCNQWAKIRSKLKRDGVPWYGVRVVEPHHDGCPHWHLAVFTQKAHIGHVRNVVKHYALEHDADEKGAQKRRVTFERIDLEKGSAVGYLAKYISKNINAAHIGHEIDHELEAEGVNKSLDSSATAVLAWARRWRIKQFEFFGTSPVTIYRELRRFKDQVPDAVRDLWNAADMGDWAVFQRLFDDYEPKLITDKTALNRYAEFSQKIKGVAVKGFALLTRLTGWAKRKKSHDSGDTWSTVPNCTQGVKRQLSLPQSHYEWARKHQITPETVSCYTLLYGELPDEPGFQRRI